MPPYDPRGRGNDAGAGGKRHRAVLLGVDTYEHLPPLLPVARSVQLMRQALTAGATGVLDPGDLIVPEGELGHTAFRAALSEARDQAEGLLLVYFAGHGLVRSNGTDLHLMVSGSRVTQNREHPFVDAISWQHDVMGSLIHAKADWVVVILDCCYAGNALRDFTPDGEQNFAVLTAAEAGVEIPEGSPADGTPFTREVHRLLTDGIPGQSKVTFTGLVAAVREAMEPVRAVDEHRWLPDERRRGDDVVLSHAAPASVPAAAPPATAPPIQEPPPAPVRARSGGRLRHRLKNRAFTRTAAVVLTVLALAAAGGVYALTSGQAAACAPPTELRLLADPDALPTVQKAVDGYLQRPGGCRTVGITVYAGKGTDAVTAFRNSAVWQSPPATCPATGDCLRPQRDLGAQPDIWIPGASSTWERAREAGKQAVTLDRLGPVAYSPLVLAVPGTVSLPAADQTGTPLSVIIGHLRAPQSQAALLRPDPEYTDAALLGTVALYTSLGGSGQSPAEIEQGMVQALSPSPSTANDLMCALARGTNNALEDRAAVLVPEQTMARFNLGPADPGHPTCTSATLSKRIANYPSDLPMADLPFIHVTWKGADRHSDERAQAVRDLYTWLTGTDAQTLFTGDGYRGVSDVHPAIPGPGSLLTDPANSRAVRTDLLPSVAPEVSTAALDRTLQSYRQALGPGRVLYLLDSSSSMDGFWTGPGRAKDLLARSLRSLGTKDEYGIWSVVEDGSAHHRELLPFGTHDRKAAEGKVAEATTVRQDARPDLALHEALAELRGRAKNGDRPQLIVFITDDEDSTGIPPSALTSLVQDAAAGAPSRVVTVSLHSGGCTAVALNQRITAATGGRCLDPAVELATELPAEVAKTGTGDAE